MDNNPFWPPETREPLILPNNLAPLETLTDSTPGPCRFALKCVHVERTIDADPADPTRKVTGYTATATNGKMLLSISGPNACNPGELPAQMVPDSTGGDKGADKETDSANIAAEDWKQTFRTAKATAKRNKRKPTLGNVVVQPGKDSTTITALNDTSQEWIRATVESSQEGHYPDYRGELPKTKPVATIRVSAAYLASLCKAIQALAPEDLHQAVTLEIHPSRKGPCGDMVDRPLVLRAESETGQSAVGLLMPITRPDPA